MKQEEQIEDGNKRFKDCSKDWVVVTAQVWVTKGKGKTLERKMIQAAVERERWNMIKRHYMSHVIRITTFLMIPQFLHFHAISIPPFSLLSH